ncbi:MAG: TonB-dependent receptor plug domain-containing protein, partial [Prolixibacteraceae bacterium]|nr:TonB-dependent receptor plug domain-containing protein [Prolixibacteraceae bacterium]
MKLTIFLICITILGSLAAESYSQTTKLTLEIKNSSVKSILGQIEDQSEFRFFYSGSIDVERKTSISQKDKNVFDILDELFKGTGVKYEVRGRQIALMQGNETFFGNLQQTQQKAITGIVTDESGQPLPGVTVLVKGTTQGTVTNADGEYSISSLPENATLVFSFVGMRTQEIPVGEQTTINVQMEEKTIGIEEVVAIGYGVVNKRDLTGVVSKVDAEQLSAAPVSRVDQALQGKSAGVQVTSTNGSPGAGTTIRIRGGNSISASNEPLFVIDGFIGAGDLNTINPNDIESVEILKDASATAIYGARGANGVILITTKKGTVGEMRININ